MTLGFLSLTATGNGTLPVSDPTLHRLVDLTGSLSLLNPLAAPHQVTVTESSGPLHQHVVVSGTGTFTLHVRR